VGLLQLDVVLHRVHDALVVVVHRDREGLLRALLADDVPVEFRLDLRGDGKPLEGVGAVAGLELGARGLLFDLEDLIADFDALVADADLAGAGDQVPHLASALGAEGAKPVVGSPLPFGGHGRCSLTLGIISSGNRFGFADFWGSPIPPGEGTGKKERRDGSGTYRS